LAVGDSQKLAEPEVDQILHRTASRAKKRVASVRIAIVRSSSDTFRRSARTSAASAVLTPGFAPSSTSACRSHLRSVSAVIPSRPATAVIAANSDALDPDHAMVTGL
jgi:hypothetical protein